MDYLSSGTLFLYTVDVNLFWNKLLDMSQLAQASGLVQQAWFLEVCRMRWKMKVRNSRPYRVQVIFCFTWGEIVWLIRPILKCHGCSEWKLNLTCKGQLWHCQLIIEGVFALMISLITMPSLERKVYGISFWLCSFHDGLHHCSHKRHCKQGVEILINLVPTRDGSLRSPNKSQVD